MHQSGLSYRPSTRSLSLSHTQSLQFPLLPAEANKHTSCNPETCKLPTDLRPLVLAIEEFASGVKHKIPSFPQAVPAAMADFVEERVCMVNAIYKSVRRQRGVSVREGVRIVGEIMEEIRDIEEEVDERIIAWDQGERREVGEAAGIIGGGGYERLSGRVVRNLKELGKTDHRREKVREIWGKIRGIGRTGGDGDKKVLVEDGEEDKGGVKENDEAKGRIRVKIDETPRDDDGDPSPGFQPIMEWEWKLFQDDNTHV